MSFAEKKGDQTAQATKLLRRPNCSGANSSSRPSDMLQRAARWKKIESNRGKCVLFGVFIKDPLYSEKLLVRFLDKM